MRYAIEVRGLTKSYRGKTAVNGLDLTVKEGTVFGLLGANGAGKSTVTPIITPTVPMAFSATIPKNVSFISATPIVNGKKRTAACIAFGRISSGTVVPEKINMGKYSIQAITLACLLFLAALPTSNPMLSVESMVSSQLPKNASPFPRSCTRQKTVAATPHNSNEITQ